MIILCPSCKELMRANEQERHNERECPERTLNCKYCKEAFQLKSIKVSLLSHCWGQSPVHQESSSLFKGCFKVGTSNLQPDVVMVFTCVVNPPTASLITSNVGGGKSSESPVHRRDFCFFPPLTAFALLLGSWWNLSKVPDDVWRLFKEKDPQRKGVFSFYLEFSWTLVSLSSSWICSFSFSMWIISSTAANLNLPADFMLLAATCL